MSNSVQSIQTVMVYTTPQELREIADKLEKDWPNCGLGETVPKHFFIKKDQTIRVELLIDQSKMGK